MKLVDRYIVSRGARVMLSTIVIGVGILTLARLLIILRLRTIDDQGFGVIFELLVYFMPNYFGFMLPFALFWACFMITRSMSAASELRAFNAAGINNRRLLRPFLGLALITTVLNLFIYGWLEPIARYNYRALANHIENAAAYLAIPQQVFTKIGTRTVYVNKANHGQQSFQGVFLYNEVGDGSRQEIFASDARLILQGASTVLRLHKGNYLLFKDGPSSVDEARDLDNNTTFTVMDVPLESDEEVFRQRGGDAEEHTVSELLTSTVHPQALEAQQRSWVQLNYKLIVVLTALLLPFLAYAMAQSNARDRSPFAAPFAFTLVLIYQQAVDFGRVISWEHGLSPFVLLWPVFTIMAVLSIGSFVRI